jgi:transposase
LVFLSTQPQKNQSAAEADALQRKQTPIKEVAEELFLDWHAVKELDKQYMAEQLRRAGTPAPRVIGIDEIAIAQGHQYRIVVSDLERGRAIWFGGKDRSAASLDEFFAWLGPAKCGKIRLAVMDMWPAFRLSTLTAGHAPQATILYDKFHILKHLGEAMDQVRKREYGRLSGADRRFIKGQRYTLLSHWGKQPQQNQSAAEADALQTKGKTKAPLKRTHSKRMQPQQNQSAAEADALQTKEKPKRR